MRLTPPEVADIVADSGAALVIEPGPLPAGRTTFAADDQGHQDLAAVFYTSGATGRRKAC